MIFILFLLAFAASATPVTGSDTSSHRPIHFDLNHPINLDSVSRGIAASDNVLANTEPLLPAQRTLIHNRQFLPRRSSSVEMNETYPKFQSYRFADESFTDMHQRFVQWFQNAPQSVKIEYVSDEAYVGRSVLSNLLLPEVLRTCLRDTYQRYPRTRSRTLSYWQWRIDELARRERSSTASQPILRSSVSDSSHVTGVETLGAESREENFPQNSRSRIMERDDEESSEYSSSSYHFDEEVMHQTIQDESDALQEEKEIDDFYSRLNSRHDVQMNIVVNRTDLFESSKHALRDYWDHFLILRHFLNVEFKNETGADSGGVTRFILTK
jgi:hypothetical protein